MVNVYRVTAIWTGFAGAPGYSRFSFADLVDDTSRNAAGANVRSFLNSLVSVIPSGTSIAVQPTVDAFDMVSGVLTSSATMTTTPTAVVSVVGATAYPGGTGFCVTWNTSVIFNGHRVKGRTFIVPALGCYEADGTLNMATLAGVVTAGTALCTATPNFSVWSRQYSDTDPPVQIGGALSPADSASIKDSASQMRSRR